MKTKIFAYKGIVGIESNPDAEGLLAKPGGGNIGCVLNAASAEISQEALDVLKSIPRGRDGLGDIDVFKADDGRVIIGWLGGYKKVVTKDSETSRDYNPSLLQATENVEVPEDFKEFVDTQ